MKFDKDEITYKKLDKMLRIGIIVDGDLEQNVLNNALDTLGLLQFEVCDLWMPFTEDLVMRVNFEDYDDTPELETFRASHKIVKTFCPLSDFLDEYRKVLMKNRKKREPHEFINTAYQTLQPSISSAASAIQETAQSFDTVNFIDITASSPFTLDDWVQQRQSLINLAERY